MEKLKIPFFITILIFSLGCSTLDVSEIKNLEATSFVPLKLKPDFELNNLRIDIIRNTTTETINNQTTTTEVKYHPLGFNLGNGLFYDLNENLSLRIDYLLNFKKSKNFELHEINRPYKNKGIIKSVFRNDSLFVSNILRNNIKYQYHLIRMKDSLLVKKNNRLIYAIVHGDSITAYRGKNRIRDAIYLINQKRFSLNKKRKREFYERTNNEIKLEKDLIISKSRNSQTIKIKKRRKSKTKFQIKHDKNAIFIYDKNYAGLKIVIERNILEIYDNKHLVIKYELRKNEEPN